MGWIGRAWRGEERLAQVFWVYGVLAGIGFGVIDILIKVIGITQHLIILPYIAFRITYSVWLTVAQWRCAFNAEWRIWGYILRTLIVIGIAVMLFFAIGIAGTIIRISEKPISADCKIAALEFAAESTFKLGNDTDFADCLKQIRADRNGTSPSSPSTPLDAIPSTPGALPSPTGSAPVNQPDQEYDRACRGTMTEYAIQHGADPNKYIAQNPAWLQQCIQYYAGTDAEKKKR